MNRINNDLRDWLDEEEGRRLPKGVEDDRRRFLTAMAEIKDDMVLGVDKNVDVEPTIWTIEWARDFYGYPCNEID